MKHGTVAIDRHEPNCHQPAAVTPSQLTIARGCAPCSTGQTVYVTGDGETPIEASDRADRAAEVYLAHEAEQRRPSAVKAFGGCSDAPRVAYRARGGLRSGEPGASSRDDPRAMRSEPFVESESFDILVRAGLNTAEDLGEPMKHNHRGRKG